MPNYIETLNEETKRLHRIVEQLLDASSVGYDLTLTTMVDVDVLELTQYLFDNQKTDLAQKQITLHMPKASRNMITLAAHEHISRAIANVVDNAIKYADENGTITVSITHIEQNTIPIIRLVISNTGKCPPKNEHETIFTRFYRGVNSLDLAIAGAGLGLSISRHIIEQYGGKIRLDCPQENLIAVTIDLLAVRPMSEVIEESFPTNSATH